MRLLIVSKEKKKERKKKKGDKEGRGYRSWEQDDDRDEKGRRGPRPSAGPNSLQGVRCRGPLTRPLPTPVITHAVNKSGREGRRRRRKVRVLGGALRLRVPGHVPHVRERWRAFNGRTLPRYIAHQLIHVFPSPIIFFAPCVSRASYTPPELYSPLNLPSLFLSRGVELILLYHLEYSKYILYRDFYCIGQLILFLLDRCYRLLFLYLLIGKYSNLSNGTNCNFEIGFNYNALLIAIFPFFFFLKVLNSSYCII